MRWIVFDELTRWFRHGNYFGGARERERKRGEKGCNFQNDASCAFLTISKFYVIERWLSACMVLEINHDFRAPVFDFYAGTIHILENSKSAAEPSKLLLGGT